MWFFESGHVIWNGGSIINLFHREYYLVRLYQRKEMQTQDVNKFTDQTDAISISFPSSSSPPLQNKNGQTNPNISKQSLILSHHNSNTHTLSPLNSNPTNLLRPKHNPQTPPEIPQIILRSFSQTHHISHETKPPHLGHQGLAKRRRFVGFHFSWSAKCAIF